MRFEDCPPGTEWSIVDWDFDSYILMKDEELGTVYMCYNFEDNPPFLLVEGWPAVGHRMEPTLFELVPGRELYKLVAGEKDPLGDASG